MNHDRLLARPLFEGERIVLAAPDAERDAEVESGWTHDADYLRGLSPDPARPLTTEQVKKRYAASIKKDNKEFLFMIRGHEDDRLLGFVRLYWIAWNTGAAMLSLGIGNPADRGYGYGREALDLILRYAFAELNLYRVAVVTSSDNEAANRFLARAGFSLEVRQREAIRRDGRYHDALMVGMLAAEWAGRSTTAAAGEPQNKE